jgi:branched-chain amino acid transport system ATP-binding protein
MLSVSDLSVHYGGIRAVDRVSLTVEAGEAVAILGPNGAGKTTLLRALAGLERPAEGSVTFAGSDVTGHGAERMVRAGIALVPEGRGVFADLSVRDNLVLGAYHHRRVSLDGVHALFPLLRERGRQRAGTLSGGEQQMLAIGRALMARPRLLLLDEPTLGLAPLAVRQVVERLSALRAQGTTILLVEQNTRAASAVATRGYVLRQGRIAAEGTTEELLGVVETSYLGRCPA